MDQHRPTDRPFDVLIMSVVRALELFRLNVGGVTVGVEERLSHWIERWMCLPLPFAAALRPDVRCDIAGVLFPYMHDDYTGTTFDTAALRTASGPVRDWNFLVFAFFATRLRRIK